jgi:hypothetical protein
MSDATLAVSLSQPSQDDYWINIVQVGDEDNGMTVGDAAELVDESFDVKVCDENYDPFNVEGNEAEEPDPFDIDMAIAEYALGMEWCDVLPDGSYYVQLKVFLSHPLEDSKYVLRLSNGLVQQTLPVTEEVTHKIDVDGQEYVILDNPIVSEPVMEWLNPDDGPELMVSGNKIYWEGETTGTIQATFRTSYYLVDIRVDGDPKDLLNIQGTFPIKYNGTGFFPVNATLEDEDIQCTVMGFYHLKYEDLVLHKPERDESVSADVALAICNGNYAESVVVEGPEPLNCYESCLKYCDHIPIEDVRAECGIARTACLEECDGDPVCEDKCQQDFEHCYANAKPEPTEECKEECEEDCTRDCYKKLNVIERCHCSNQSHTNQERITVDCPIDTPTGTELKQDEETTEFYDCGGRDEFFEEDYYNSICEEPKPDNLYILGYDGMDLSPSGLPWCGKMTRALTPSKEPNPSARAVIESKYPNVSWRGVGPESNICGDWEVEQIAPCDANPPPIEWGTSGQVVEPGGHVTVYISGGTPPFTFRLNGEGFMFGNGTGRIDTFYRSATIYADFDACGRCNISVVDQCGEGAKGAVKSVEGEWHTVALLTSCGIPWCTCSDGWYFASEATCSGQLDGESCYEYTYEDDMRYLSKTAHQHVLSESTRDMLNETPCHQALDLPGVCEPIWVVNSCASGDGVIWGWTRVRSYQAWIWGCPGEEHEWEYVP